MPYNSYRTCLTIIWGSYHVTLPIVINSIEAHTLTHTHAHIHTRTYTYTHKETSAQKQFYKTRHESRLKSKYIINTICWKSIITVIVSNLSYKELSYHNSVYKITTESMKVKFNIKQFSTSSDLIVPTLDVKDLSFFVSYFKHFMHSTKTHLSTFILS